jgi:hypothetical protein
MGAGEIVADPPARSQRRASERRAKDAVHFELLHNFILKSIPI